MQQTISFITVYFITRIYSNRNTQNTISLLLKKTENIILRGNIGFINSMKIFPFKNNLSGLLCGLQRRPIIVGYGAKTTHNLKNI